MRKHCDHSISLLSNQLSHSQIQPTSERYKVIMKPWSCSWSSLEKISKPVALKAFFCTWAIFVFFCWNLQRRNIRVPDWSLNCSWNGCSSWTVSPKLQKRRKNYSVKPIYLHSALKAWRKVKISNKLTYTQQFDPLLEESVHSQ